METIPFVQLQTTNYMSYFILNLHTRMSNRGQSELISDF